MSAGPIPPMGGEACEAGEDVAENDALCRARESPTSTQINLLIRWHFQDINHERDPTRALSEEIAHGGTNPGNATVTFEHRE